MLKLGCCLAFALWANVTDWKSCKIRNRAVLILSAAGLLANVVIGGVSGLLSALAGGACMLCLFPLFAIRALGAGDVKGMMAVGCMLGVPEALWALAYSLLGGGVVAVCVLVIRKNGRERIAHFCTYCKSCFLSRTLLPYEIGREGSGGFRFSYGITLGLLALLLQRL